MFRSIRLLFDGGERAAAPVMDRVALSIGSPSVSLILNLDDLPPGKSTVAGVQRHLAQQYRNLEVLLVCAARSVPTEMRLAFDLVETGSAEEGTMYRSRRDDRLSCIVTGGIETDAEWWQVAIAAASGELILPIDPRWDLRLSAVAELAAPWVRRPRTAASVGLVHPETGGMGSRVDLVTARADMMAVAGLGTGAKVLGALGAVGSGYDGCVVGVFARAVLERIGGVPGPIGDPATWTEIGRRLHVDGRERNSENRIQIQAHPIGFVGSSGRQRIVDSTNVSRSSWSVGVSARAALERTGSVQAPIGDPAVWAEIRRRLEVDDQDQNNGKRIQLLARPIEFVRMSRRRRIGGSMKVCRPPLPARSLHLVYRASSVIPFLVAVSLFAAVAGRVTGLISSDLLWIAATTPVLSAVVVILGLMMDDRAVTPVGTTTARLQLLGAAIGAALWGTLGSPLRRTAGELNRA